VIDTHAHLDGCADRPSAILRRARDAGVERVISIGTDPDSWRATLAIAERERDVFAALGVPPHDAETATVDGLGDLLFHERCVAVGECGLDYYRDYAPRKTQIKLFERHLELAAEYGKPVVVHTRAANDDTLAVLAGFDGTVILHCFSEPHLLEAATERDYYLSFAGNVTYKNAPDLRLAASRVRADRILVETDSPYLAPQSRRGRPNEPAFIGHTVATLAEARRTTPEELAAQIDANATAAFGLPPA
jgi:TatD DNase family protein